MLLSLGDGRETRMADVNYLTSLESQTQQVSQSQTWTDSGSPLMIHTYEQCTYCVPVTHTHTHMSSVPTVCQFVIHMPDPEIGKVQSAL